MLHVSVPAIALAAVVDHHAASNSLSSRVVE
jgi:hypothetical protein